MPTTVASASTSVSAASMITPPKKKKKGGFFGCRSKHALDSLPRNARGQNAAIHRLQVRTAFGHSAESSTSTTAVSPVTHEKIVLKLTAPDDTATVVAPSPIEATWVKPTYAQEVLDDEATSNFHEKHHPIHGTEQSELEEARDVLLDDVLLVQPSHAEASSAARSTSVSSKAERIKRSLSLKRSASTASAKLIARAPPVSSADFTDLPESSGSSSDLSGEGDNVLGGMASIRKARDKHQRSVLHQHGISEVSENGYLDLDNAPVPPTSLPPSPTKMTTAEQDSSTPVRKQAMRVYIPESDSMRAVAAALESSNDSFSFQPGPSVATPRFEPSSPSQEASIAEVRELDEESAEDKVHDLPGWSYTPGPDDFDPRRPVFFQNMTNMTRPVSVASLRSLATPNTPPRTSSRFYSRNGTCAGNLRATKSFSVSPVKRQGTFNGFPRTFFPGSTLRHSASIAGGEHQSRQCQLDHEGLAEETGDTRAEDVDRQLESQAATCSHCGTVQEQRDFAAFVAKGKASRRVSVKQQTLKTAGPTSPLAGSLRKSKSARNDTVGEGTLKRWGLAEAFQSSATAAGDELKKATLKMQKKMVPGPGGRMITDTANMRWCSALDEIKKALAEDDVGRYPEAGADEEDNAALERAHSVLARLGVEA